jgi:hypothetical protein
MMNSAPAGDVDFRNGVGGMNRDTAAIDVSKLRPGTSYSARCAAMAGPE